MLHFEEKTFDSLSAAGLYELLQLRSEVFIVEQRCFYQDLDGKDQAARHLLGREDGRLTAYARWYPVLDGDGFHLGRIVSHPEVRGTGRGKAIVAEALRRIGPRPVVIQAQAHLELFYAAFGFLRTGPDFDLDGIPHTPMRRG